jgi:PAS domain S-box-containing protein
VQSIVVLWYAVSVNRSDRNRKDAERALQSTQDQLQIVTDNMAVAVTRCNREFRYLWVSPGCAAWLQRRSEDIIGKTILEVLGPKAFAVIRPHIERALAGERVEFETQLNYQDLGLRWVRAVYVPTYDHAGKTDGWVAVITDLTALKELEESLRQADRRKDEFLATLAHELRNPLAPISNSLALLRMGIEGIETRPAIDIMERQMGQMVRIVDDLLDVSRITRNKIELRKERVLIADVMQSAVETSRPLMDAARHKLTVTLPPEPIWLHVDPTRIAQVIANLLNNAAKFTPAGGSIGLTVTAVNGEAIIQVRDAGVGIPADMLPRVFDMFTQVDMDRGRSRGGLGIGLTLVKSLTEQHGGSVEAHSAGPGQGSEFVVRLPIAAPMSISSQPVKNGAYHENGQLPRRILVVDDNRDSADSLSVLLKLMGNEVRTAYDGPTALKEADHFRPELALLDLGMAGMSGFELARHLRAHPELQEVVLVAVTGWGQKEDRHRTQEAGFDHHLTKPVDYDLLRSVLQPNHR